MGYFDENEKTEETQESGSKAEEIQALIEGAGALSKEEKRLEKERKKEEKRLEKERRKQEKMERRMQKEGIDELPDVSIADLKRAAKEAAEESKRAMDEVEGKTAGHGAPEEQSDESQASDNKHQNIITESQIKTTDEEAEIMTEGSASEQDADQDPDQNSDQNETGSEKKSRKKKKSKQKERPEDVNIVKDLLSLIIYIGIVVLICFLIVTFVGRRTTVHGDSMEPTLQSGDGLWINMLAYKFGEPKRYDIIVFPYEDDVNYIKRIIGLPGETVQITDNGDILINGEVLVEPKSFDRIRNNGIASSPITLGPDEVFVLGDNRNNSRDSRWADVGNIKLDKIIGRAAFRLLPLKKFGSID